MHDKIRICNHTSRILIAVLLRLNPLNNPMRIHHFLRIRIRPQPNQYPVPPTTTRLPSPPAEAFLSDGMVVSNVAEYMVVTPKWRR